MKIIIIDWLAFLNLTIRLWRDTHNLFEYSGERKETITPVELQYVQVLAVKASSGLDTEEYIAPGESKFVEDEKELPSTITLKITVEQAKLLADLEIKGKIHVVFVYRGSEENCNEFLE